MTRDIELGGVVGLKSGGPDMTVVERKPLGLQCTWFDGSTMKLAIFPAEALERRHPTTSANLDDHPSDT